MKFRNKNTNSGSVIKRSVHIFPQDIFAFPGHIFAISDVPLFSEFKTNGNFSLNIFIITNTVNNIILHVLFANRKNGSHKSSLYFSSVIKRNHKEQSHRGHQVFIKYNNYGYLLNQENSLEVRSLNVDNYLHKPISKIIII